MSLKPGYFKQFCSFHVHVLPFVGFHGLPLLLATPILISFGCALCPRMPQRRFEQPTVLLPTWTLGPHVTNLHRCMWISPDVCPYPDVHHGWSAGATRDLGAPLLRLWLLTWNGWSRPPFWQENEVNCTWRLWTFTKRCCLRMTRDVLNFIPDSTHRCM